MRGVLLVLVLARTAHADDPTELHDDARAEGLTRAATGPLLHLETALHTDPQTFATEHEHQQVDFSLGPIAQAQIESNAWRGDLFNGTGWGGTIRLWRNVYGFQVGFEASMNRVDSALTHGTYRLVGLTIMRTKKLSRWMTAWISLTVGKREWIGQPPPGEVNDTAAMLSIGTTFR